MNAQDYRDALQALLPPGAALTREPGAVLTRFLEGLAQEGGRIDARAQGLLDDMDPRTTAELLADWERVAGLPDACIVGDQTTQQRRDALVAKLTNLGGQSRQYFIDLAAHLGFTITITEFAPFTVNSLCTDPLCNEPWRYHWQANAPSTTVREFSVAGACTDPLRSWGNQALECLISRLKPAHTTVTFAYGA